MLENFDYSKLFIGTPTHIIKGYCAADYSAGIASLGEPKIRSVVVSNSQQSPMGMYPPYMPFIDIRNLPAEYHNQRDSIHRRIVATMNLIRGIFLQTDCEYFLSLEADLVISKEILESMLWWLEHDKRKEISILYTNCYTGFIHNKDLGNKKILSVNDDRCCYQINKMTLGCTLVRRDVLRQIEFRYDKHLIDAFHDAFFAMDSEAAGFSIYYDPNIVVPHMDQGNGRGWANLPRQELGLA